MPTDKLNLPWLFLGPWLASAAVTMSGIFEYHDFSILSVGWIVLPALIGWALMHAVGTPARLRQRRSATPAQAAPTWRLFSALCVAALLGNLALQQAYAGSLGDLAGGGQEAYVAIVSGDIQPNTGILGTFGQLLRISQPLLVVCAVFMLARPRRIAARALIAGFTTITIYLGYVASMSRGQFLLVGTCAVVASLRAGIPRGKLLAIVLLLALVGTTIFSLTSASRYEILNVDPESVAGAAAQLFRIVPSSLDAPWVHLVGIHAAGLLIYLTEPLVECFRLMRDDASPLFMGALTFGPLLNPFAHILGVIPDTTLVGKITQPNMWYSLLGDLYLDFGYAATVVLPVLALGMYVLARRYTENGFWGQALAVVTGAFFLIFPLHSAFISFAPVYAFALIAAIVESRSRRRASTRRSHKLSSLAADPRLAHSASRLGPKHPAT